MRNKQMLSFSFVLLLPITIVGCGAIPDSNNSPGMNGVSQNDAIPTFQVDPSWPKEMPDNWIIGAVTSVFVDHQDHIWLTHLQETLTPEETAAIQDPPIGICCQPAPTVIEFDTEGNVVQAWGNPSQEISLFPKNPHGLFVDHNDYVWIGTYRHHRVMKFTRSGEHILTIGEYDQNGGSNDTELLGGPAGIWVDPNTNEVYIADGYRNRRVVVYEGETGNYARHWGAYGKIPEDDYQYNPINAAESQPLQFSNVHGLTGSRDGIIYVADRRGNRIQTFNQNGEFIEEKIIAPLTRGSGSAFVIALSPDPDQTWLYLADGTNHKVWQLRRKGLELVANFGRGGRFVGQFLRPHGMGIDSEGNLYVGEASTGRRIQKFAIQQ